MLHLYIEMKGVYVYNGLITRITCKFLGIYLLYCTHITSIRYMVYITNKTVYE